MAQTYEPTDVQAANWNEWVQSRPTEIRHVAERFNPWTLYRLKPTNHRVTLRSFSAGSPVTMSVNILKEFNALAFERYVFGVSPDDLEECALPAEGEMVGVVLTEEADIQEFIAKQKANRH